MQSPRPWTLPLLFCVLAVWAAAAPRAGAGTTPIVVTTNADTGPGTLREAIILANRQAGTDTIAFRIQGPEPQPCIFAARDHRPGADRRLHSARLAS